MQQRIKKLITYKDEENGAEDNNEWYGHLQKQEGNPSPRFGVDVKIDSVTCTAKGYEKFVYLHN